MTWAQQIIDGTTKQAEWLRGVIFGEWEDNKSLSQCVTDALAGLTPGLGNILAFRDLIAIIFRLAKYPEKREHVEEWLLLIAMLLPLALTVIGVIADGVGALVGAEVGAFLRALILLMVKEGGIALKALVEFFQHHGYGNVIAALRQVKFAKHKQAITDIFVGQINKLQSIIRNLETQLQQLQKLPDWLPGHDALRTALIKSQQWGKALQALGLKGREMIPKAMLELDARLGKLLAGDIKAATRSTHTVTAGVKAEKAVRAEAAGEKAKAGMQPAKTPGNPEPGNVRRINERRLLAVPVEKHGQEFRFADQTGLPVGAKPYKDGATAVDHPKLKRSDWDKHSDAVTEGYPDLAKNPYSGKADTKYDTFANLQKADLKPGDKIVRVVAHDAEARSDAGPFWTKDLPADGRELRADAAVKEDWNKDGSYVEMTVPPKSDTKVWEELGYDTKAPDFDPKIKGWKGTASSQVYEYKNPASGAAVRDDYYLPGGGQQLYMDPKQMAVLKKHKYITQREPTNFKDYDPNIVNTDGTKGNIVPDDGPILENVPLDQASIRAAKTP